MPLATYSTTHSSTIPKLQLDYLNKVYKRQAIIEALSAARPKQAADTAHKRQISEAIPQNERPIARQARPEPAERDTWEDRQGDAEGGAAAGTTTRRSDLR